MNEMGNLKIHSISKYFSGKFVQVLKRYLQSATLHIIAQLI